MIYHRIAFILLIALSSFNGSAAENPAIGDVAQSFYEPVTLIIQLVRGVSFICGSGLILGGVLKFIDHRRNPVASRLSAVIFMFIFGFALILVGMIPDRLGS